MSSSPLPPSTPLPDAVWSAQRTTPDAIEAALRELVNQRHSENGVLVPARALNMVTFVESSYSGEIANRLAAVGRYHASRLVVLSYDPHRTTLNARAVVSSEGEPGNDELGLLRETVTVEIGERHLDDLVTIVDPLVVTDLTTLLWSPHGHPEAVDALLELVCGHPQRAMLCAHHLFEQTPRGATADLDTFERALAAIDRETGEAFEKLWDDLVAKPNQRKVLMALARSSETLYNRRTLDAYGLKKGSAEAAARALIGRGELQRTAAGFAIVDPLLERWLAQAGG